MAEPQNESSSNADPKRLLGPGLLLWGLSLVAGAIAGSVVSGMRADATVEASSISIAAYAAYTPATLLALWGTYYLLAAAMKTAMESASGGASDSKQMLDALERINKRLLLSDTAKRIAYRQEDLDVLRKTIREDIAKHRFDAALALIAELAQTYGFKEEAEAFRDQIAGARAAEIESKIDQALQRLEDVLARHDFERATAEVAKLQRLYPESVRVAQAERRVSQALEAYKQDIEHQFLEAQKRGDDERAMELIKEMDRYLTPQEAAPFREIARGVIGQLRENLGMQFLLAARDEEWVRAVRIGEQIIREFPNTKMAEEVRGKLDLARERAARQQATSGVASV
ncbi:MAG: hypothetical protein AAF078_02910 [Planctomycetota bacterium]